MSDEDPSTPLPEVDRPLQRRVAWGLLAGWTKAEIASAEGITLDELNAALAGPCMFMLVNVWGVFFKEGDRGDMPLLRLLVRWALDFVLENAERTQGAGIAKAFLIKVSLRLGFKGTLKLLCDHIEGVIGIQDRRAPLHGVRGGLALVMAWAIEIALMQLFIYQMGEEEIVRRDEYFREQILLREFDATEEDAIPAAAETPPAVVPTAPLAEPFEPWVVGSSPTMTMVSTGVTRPTLSWPAPEPGTRGREAGIPAERAEPSRPRLAHSMCDAEPVERPLIVRHLLYESVRFKRRRCSLPPVVRHLPIGRAA